jgi:hypothetical protein
MTAHRSSQCAANTASPTAPPTSAHRASASIRFMLRRVGAASWANRGRDAEPRQQVPRNNRANLEQLFARSGPISQRSILRSARATPNAARNIESTANAEPRRATSPSSSTKFSIEILTDALRARGRAGLRHEGASRTRKQPNEVNARRRASSRSVAVMADKYRARAGASHRAFDPQRPHQLAGMRRGTFLDGSRASITRAPGQRGRSESEAKGVRPRAQTGAH